MKSQPVNTQTLAVKYPDIISNKMPERIDKEPAAETFGTYEKLLHNYQQLIAANHISRMGRFEDRKHL